MKILVAIANFGSKNQPYLDRLLAEYRAMPYDVHPVVLSDVDKDKGKDVEIMVGIPSTDPMSLPFAHKKLFANRLNDFDLFIYTEDDTLISERNIAAFLEVTPHLREGEIAGFLRTEEGSDGARYVSSIHHRFHWDPASVCERGGRTFACFSNMHSAAFMLTRSQLERAIDSGGFLVAPHDERYAMLETAATDPYTQCGFRKMICVSSIEDFLLPHLPNNYVGVMGLGEEDFHRQIEALHAVGRGDLPDGRLFETETRIRLCLWSKSYYEPAREDMLAMVPRDASSVLSLACGWGATEEALVKRGAVVTAVPLDKVIASCAAARGVEIVDGPFEAARRSLSDRRFDCLLVSNVLHLVEDPAGLLRSFAGLLAPGGIAVAAIPNFSAMHLWIKNRLHDASIARPPAFAESGVHAAGSAEFRGWVEGAGLVVQKVAFSIPERNRTLAAALVGSADRILATDLVLSARLPAR